MFEKLKNIKDARTVSEPLRKEIMNLTSHLDSTVSLIERIYILLNGDQSICEHGNRKQFKNFKMGYLYCGKACTCALIKRKQTMVERHGVENPAQSIEIRKKRKQTMIERYGSEHALQNSNIKEKMKQNNLEKLGVENPRQNIEVQEKMKQTNIKKFGTTYASQNSNIKEKIRQTTLDRYGVEHVLQNPEILNKHKQTMIMRYGTEHALQNIEIQEKLRKNSISLYGRNNSTQSHITDEGYDILQSETELRKIIDTHSISEIAEKFNIHITTICNYCQKYNIDLPSSTYETAISSFFKQHNISYQLHNRQLIKPLEIDIVLPDYKIGIEFCGLYWHSELRISDKKYHLNKLRQMNSIGYRLITIFEDEWLHKRNIVERRLLNFIGLSEKGKGARNLIIKQIEWNEAKQFLDTYHIQGAGTSGYVRYGAYDGTDIVAVMTFSKPRLALGKKKDSDVFDELLRFATNGKNYAGVASRLMVMFIKEYDPVQIISYADRRWSEGNLYKQLGFEMFPETDDVNYWHVKGTHRWHRFNFRKDKIKHLFEDKTMTEREIMYELGYNRIWDCGTIKFVWNK